jgi:hypothetical protein
MRAILILGALAATSGCGGQQAIGKYAYFERDSIYTYRVVDEPGGNISQVFISSTPSDLGQLVTEESETVGRVSPGSDRSPDDGGRIQYVLSTSDGDVVVTAGKQKSVLLRLSAHPESEQWKNSKVVLGTAGGKHASETCRIAKRDHQHVLSRSLNVISVQCELQTNDAMVTTMHHFAESLGLIGREVRVTTTSGEDLGRLVMTLIDVRGK